MIEHIVKNNETIDSICNLYHVSEMELKWNNSHITDWNNIPFGVKLWIPILSEDVEQVLEKTEPFVMDYYPEISDEIIPNIDNKDSKNEELEETNKAESKTNVENFRTQLNFKAYSGILPPKRPYKGR